MRIFILLTVLFLVACKSEVVHNLPELEANKVIVLLQKHGIEAQKTYEQAGSSWAISVDEDDEARAIEVLINSRVFQHLALSTKEAPDNQVNGGIFASSQLQRFQLEELKARGIEKTLLRIPNVLDARVNFNLPKDSEVFEEKFTPQSASALLIVSSEFAIDKQDISHLIAKSVGIDADQVAVLLSFEQISEQPDSKIEPSAPVVQNRSYFENQIAPLIRVGVVLVIIVLVFAKLAVAIAPLIGVGVVLVLLILGLTLLVRRRKKASDITILEP